MQTPEPATAGATSPSGFAAAGAKQRIAGHRRAWLIAAGALVFVILGSGAVFAGAQTGANEPAAASVLVTRTATPSPTPTVDPARPVPAEATTASRLRTCSVAGLAADARLADFQAQVKNATTGEVLFDRGGTTSSRTASVMKVLTSAAALNVLGTDYRATTRVVKGAEPGQVVLVGGGDLTLTRLPTGQEPFYAGAAHLDDLATQTMVAWAADPANPPITSLVLDSSYFSGPDWDEGWARTELGLGYMPEITALMVDGDRDDPTRSTSARSEDPIARAGQAFSDALGGGLTISQAAAPAGAAQLGAVQSATVSTLVQQSLIVSDNTIAEMLARLVAIENGAGNSFSALQQGIVGGLSGYGIDTTGMIIKDGSGLSPQNAVAPAYLTALFLKVNAREGNLGVLFDGLPIAGGPRGSLSYSDRFAGANSVADGAVFAKTGWIDTGYTLAGVIHAADGTPLTFAIYAIGNVSSNAKIAIDTLTTGFFHCGDNLSNN
ncbi:D-alanyl-D-alanine carboxypeptidase/D-alanyl-D-alanine-endopeptidase [Cryobacterium ruanii]|uniref:D-alanyl-D-alanine carboxypeptidase/D-alanyl-D-alanine-endopeptidase n=1 Tax=Cryobacterium ruanii TaxID=1259197 RepID=UPI001F54638C|nr:D-alanyl-D-alanine carboxypeptidase [Cryobacterium ruanii]